MLGGEPWESKYVFGVCFGVSLKGMMQACRIIWKTETARVDAHAKSV